MKIKLILMTILVSGLLLSCNSDDKSDTGNGEPTAAVDKITIEMQHIVTPVDGQPASNYIKYNMLGGEIYFQELTGSPWEGNARLWSFSILTNAFTLKNARGESFSWSGWGNKLFNLNGQMVHIDQTSEPSAEYYVGANDNWVPIATNVPENVVAGDVAVSGQHAYFLGGEFSNAFHSFLPDTGWSDIAPFPISIEDPVLVADTNFVYSIGGREVENGMSEANYFARYSIDGNEWETLENVPHGTTGSNSGNRALIINDRFLVVLTSDENNTLLDLYDTEKKVWKTEPLSTQYPVNYMYEFNGTLYFLSESYSETTEIVTRKLYKGTLGNLPI